MIPGPGGGRICLTWLFMCLTSNRDEKIDKVTSMANSKYVHMCGGGGGIEQDSVEISEYGLHTLSLSPPTDLRARAASHKTDIFPNDTSKYTLHIFILWGEMLKGGEVVGVRYNSQISGRSRRLSGSNSKQHVNWLIRITGHCSQSIHDGLNARYSSKASMFSRY